jgi:hypothetical protein
MKYKGTYRILAELDRETNDIPRDKNGDIDETFDDFYISCHYGNRITVYGHDTNGRVLLEAYIPSVTRGRNIVKALDQKGIPYTNYLETDEEVIFRFKPKDIEEVATLLKAKTGGANISPLSSKNLPKANVQIPTEEIEKYRAIIKDVEKGDLLLIHKATTAFLTNILNKRLRKTDKNFNYASDIKKMKMSRMTKEYIWSKGLFNEYLIFLKKEINKFYNNK